MNERLALGRFQSALGEGREDTTTIAAVLSLLTQNKCPLKKKKSFIHCFVFSQFYQFYKSFKHTVKLTQAVKH